MLSRDRDGLSCPVCRHTVHVCSRILCAQRSFNVTFVHACHFEQTALSTDLLTSFALQKLHDAFVHWPPPLTCSLRSTSDVTRTRLASFSDIPPHCAPSWCACTLRKTCGSLNLIQFRPAALRWASQDAWSASLEPSH